MKLIIEQDCLNEFLELANSNIKSFKKIIKLIKDINKHPFEGIGKPEPLKHNLSGYWSRRINKKDRLVYEIEKNSIIIISCKSHY